MEKNPQMQLIALGYSPWSEKARWALDWSGKPYDEIEYVPMVGAPWLRWKTGTWRGKISVPVLIEDDGTAVADSYAIALRVAPGLFGDDPPRALEPDIERWNVQSELVLAAARVVVLDRMARSRAARLESVPAFVPRALRPLMLPGADLGIRHVRKKYGEPDGHDTLVRSVLEGLRTALADGEHLVAGKLTFADVAMAVSLQFVKPPSERWLRIGEGLREALTDEELARDYEDLVAWRDRIYERHRR